MVCNRRGEVSSPNGLGDPTPTDFVFALLCALCASVVDVMNQPFKPGKQRVSLGTFGCG